LQLSIIQSWEGNEWQEHVVLLLRTRYPPGGFQEVPDKHRGDFGIEGYSRRDGCVYQCYAAQEPLSTNDRYEAQRDKITGDLNKFVRNQADLLKIFGTLKISRWILVVPFYDSALLVQHCQTKTAEILAAALPYVSHDFVVHVDTDDMFAAEKNALKKRNIVAIDVEASALPKPDVDRWALGNTNAVAALARKAKLLGTLNTPDRVDAFVKRMIGHHLNGQEVLRELHDRYAAVYEEVVKSKASREGFLETLALATADLPPQLLQKTLEQYINDLQNIEVVVSPRTAELLAHEAIADWLMRCPLDFPETP